MQQRDRRNLVVCFPPRGNLLRNRVGRNVGQDRELGSGGSEQSAEKCGCRSGGQRRWRSEDGGWGEDGCRERWCEDGCGSENGFRRLGWYRWWYECDWWRNN